MALTSILLAFAAGLSISLGVLTTPFPVVGSVFSFGAPLLGVLGIVLGSRAMARARAGGERSTAGLIGVIFNAMTLPPALGVALTCGTFNAALTNGSVQSSTNFQVSHGQGSAAGAGVDTAPPPPPFAPGLLAPDAGATGAAAASPGSAPAAPDAPAPAAPTGPGAAPGASPPPPSARPALPPPPSARPALPPPPLPPE
jgi:hypothetical protein